MSKSTSTSTSTSTSKIESFHKCAISLDDLIIRLEEIKKEYGGELPVIIQHPSHLKNDSPISRFHTKARVEVIASRVEAAFVTKCVNLIAGREILDGYGHPIDISYSVEKEERTKL